MVVRPMTLVADTRIITPSRALPCARCSPRAGASEVCLTDGDEESLRLTKRNAEANLPPPPGSLPLRSHPDTNACSSEQQQTPAPGAPGSEPGNDGDTGERNSDSRRRGRDDSRSSSSTGKASDGGTAGDSAVSSEDRGPRSYSANLREGAEGGPGGYVARPSGAAGGASSAASPGRDGIGVGAGGSAGGVCDGGSQRQQPANILVRKLRWGCEDDMQAVGGCAGGGGASASGGGGWDVVLGSDIAALPYASAYGDLLRTIVSLVNSPPDGGGGGRGAAASALDRGGGGEGVEGNERGVRRVTVLLAHKRRHVSEQAFFEELEERLGGEKSVRETGEEDIHADFRGMGIRLHMFEVDV